MTHRAPRLITFVLLTAITVISTNMFLPALPAMQQDFGVSPAVIGLSISIYMVVAAGLQLILGPLADRVGRRPVLLGVLGIYVLASVLCVLARDITLFLAARTVQAVAVAGGVLASAMVRDLFDGRMAAAKLATIGSAMAIAPMIAPVLGGALVLHFGWRAIFMTYAVLGGALLLWVYHDLAETQTAQARATREPVGLLLRDPRFWSYGLCQSLGVGGFFVFVTGAPFVAAATYGLNAAQIGFGVGSITIGFLVGASLSARLVERFGQMPLILLGRGLALAGLIVGLGVYALTSPPVWALFAATVWVGLGNGLTLANAYALALSVRPRLAGSAAGFVGALGNLSGAALAALATLVLAAHPHPIPFLLLIGAAVLASLLAALIGAWLERRAGIETP